MVATTKILFVVLTICVMKTDASFNFSIFQNLLEGFIKSELFFVCIAAGGESKE